MKKELSLSVGLTLWRLVTLFLLILSSVSICFSFDCSSITNCWSIGGTPCGFCWDDNTGRAGSHRGDLNQTCISWTFDQKQCPNHIECKHLPDCNNILGTSCGWCDDEFNSTNNLQHRRGGRMGGMYGPSKGWCDNWIWNVEDCPRPSPGVYQIHLSFGETSSITVVTFSTYSPTAAFVVYSDTTSVPSIERTVAAERTIFTHLNDRGLHYIYRANLTDLISGHSYSYYILSYQNSSKSSVYSFRGINTEETVTRIIIFGDFGRYGGEPSLLSIENEILHPSSNSLPLSHIIHAGDFAYDLATSDGLNGDAFMQRIQSFAANIPYQTCPGNHESDADMKFTHYKSRFTMPGYYSRSPDQLYYSYNIGLIHIISYDTEHAGDFVYMQKQLQWLKNDLLEANLNREKFPWIIAFGHRPMICSNNDGSECSYDDCYIRLIFEQIFYNAGVDLIIQAHEHSYERTWPVYNLNVTNFDYNNPLAPVHVITGAAGCNENYGDCINFIPGPRASWSAFSRSNKATYGYGHITVLNQTHLHFDEVMVADGSILDEFMIVQERHRKFGKARNSLITES